MPTQNPRVNVTLKPEVYALFKAFSEVSGQSMSALLGEIADTTAPALQRVLRVTIAAKQADEARKEGLRMAFQQAEEQLSGLIVPMEQMLGQSLDRIESAAVDAARPAQRGARPAASPDPRPSNYGGQHPPKKSRKGRKSR